MNDDSQLARFGVRAVFFASLDSVEQIYVKDLRKQKWVLLKIEGKKQIQLLSSFFLLKIPHFQTHPQCDLIPQIYVNPWIVLRTSISCANLRTK